MIKQYRHKISGEIAPVLMYDGNNKQEVIEFTKGTYRESHFIGCDLVCVKTGSYIKPNTYILEHNINIYTEWDAARFNEAFEEVK